MGTQFLIAIFVISFPLFAQAESGRFYKRDESFVCDPAKLSPAGGVLCCDQLENKSCEETQDALLTLEQKSFLNELTQTILDLPEYKKAMPSCFATSMVLAGKPVAEPFLYSGDRELKENLARYYQELSSIEEMQKGDIIIFDEQGRYYNMYDDEMGRKHYVWEPGSQLAHAMYYLGEGMVVQKENAATAVSSIATLSRTFERYSWGINLTQHIRTMDYAYKDTKLVIRVFREIRL